MKHLLIMQLSGIIEHLYFISCDGVECYVDIVWRDKCEYCGFCRLEENVYAEGAPCGYKGCTHFTCCMNSWEEHMIRDHGIDPDSEEYKKEEREGYK